jgi:hypothetical protein
MISLYFLTKTVPTLVAGGAIFLGYKLFILGVTGQASLTVQSTSIGGQLLNAAPGLFFALGGLICLGISIVKGVAVTWGGEPIALGSVTHG